MLVDKRTEVILRFIRRFTTVHDTRVNSADYLTETDFCVLSL